jgi:hypothetical protein
MQVFYKFQIIPELYPKKYYLDEIRIAVGFYYVHWNYPKSYILQKINDKVS